MSALKSTSAIATEKCPVPPHAKVSRFQMHKSTKILIFLNV